MFRTALLIGLAIGAATGGAYAADIGSLTSPTSAVDWSGFYAGVNAGYGPGMVTNSGLFYDELGMSVSFSGFFLGGQAGYNVQLPNGLVFGAEGDINWSKESGSTVISEDSGDESFATSSTLNWFGAVTGHVGYAWDRFQPYVLAGVGFANNTLNISDVDVGDPSINVSSNQTHMGFTVGIGGAAMLTDKISGFIEARYSDYGSAPYSFSYDSDTYTSPASLTDTTVRAGLNFHL